MCGATYVVALACGGTADGSVPLPPPPDRDEGLRLELLQRAKRDQQMAIATIGSLGDSTATANLAQIFTENAQYLRTVLDTHGWPGRALVGTDGADAAWTIVQHADGFPEMQERALKELEKAVAAQQAEGQWYAWLADRLAKNRRLPQIYGTQVD